MTCTQILERLIEADPDALAGRGTSDVAAHVRECARCRAVAEQLLAETRMLATTVGPSGLVVRRLRPTPIVLALAAVAALAFVMLPDQPTTPTAPTTPTTVAATPAPVAAVAVVAPPAAPAVVSPRAGRADAGAPREPRTAPLLASAYPPAVPVTVTPMQVLPAEASYQQVAVTPPPGKRVAVMRTNDPAITVVWVY